MNSAERKRGLTVLVACLTMAPTNIDAPEENGKNEVLVENVTVAVRMRHRFFVRDLTGLMCCFDRPLNKTERANGGSELWHVTPDGRGVYGSGGAKEHESSQRPNVQHTHEFGAWGAVRHVGNSDFFVSDHVFSKYSSTEAMYELVGAPLVAAAMEVRVRFMEMGRCD